MAGLGPVVLRGGHCRHHGAHCHPWRCAPALRSPYRWQDWAAPFSDRPGRPLTADGKPVGWKRQELFASGDGKLLAFINKQLLPHLHGLDIDTRTCGTAIP